MILCGLAAKAQLGTNVFPYLNLPTSARQAALGGDAVALQGDDVAMLAVNPAVNNEEMENHIALNAASYLADTKYGTLAYSKTFSENHHTGAFARYMNYGSMPRTDDAGFENGTFSAFDAMIGLNYAYSFEREWTIGANMKFLNSKIDNYTSMAVAGDFGVTYYNEKRKETVSAVARNFGYQFKTFNGVRETLPFRVDVGYSRIIPKFPVLVTITAHDLQKFDISSPLNSDGQKTSFAKKIADHFSLGAEFFPEQVFNLRLGYNIRRGSELAVADQRSFAGLSAGFGVRFKRLKIDYTHARYHSAGNMNMVGIQVDFSSNRYF